MLQLSELNTCRSQCALNPSKLHSSELLVPLPVDAILFYLECLLIANLVIFPPKSALQVIRSSYAQR